MILIFKLSTGEVIVGYVTSQNETLYDVSYPAILGPTGLEPYMGFGTGKITIYVSNIVATTTPIDNIVSSYNCMFGPTSTVDLACTKG